MINSSLFFPSSKFAGISSSISTKGGDRVCLVKTLQCSPLVPSSLSADKEASFWNSFGDHLTKSGLDFPPENEIAFQFVMANRMNEQRSFFTRFVAVTPVTDRPIIIIGNSFAKNLIGTLSKKFGFKNTFFFEVRNTSLSEDYLLSLSSVIKGNRNAFCNDYYHILWAQEFYTESKGKPCARYLGRLTNPHIWASLSDKWCWIWKKNPGS